MSASKACVIFGATGDLTFNKLLPALNHLVQLYPQSIDKVFLIGRQVKDLPAYLKLGEEKGLSQGDISLLLPKLEYVYMQAMDDHAYPSLARILQPFEARYFYLATPPAMYHVITEALSKHSLFIKGHPHHRIAYEKPFGENGSSAKVLNSLLLPLADASQLFRVDHYLAKGFLQDLLAIRKSYPNVNALLTAEHIAKVEVKAHETLGILSRGKFYDATGALQDMVQSHLLQTLALAVMPLPKNLTVQAIQQQKFQFFSSLVPQFDANQFGQYQGYLQEAYVQPESLTETFVRLYFKSSLPTFKSINFIISTGKKLPEKKTEINIIFRQGGTLTLSLYPSYRFKIDETLKYSHLDEATLQELQMMHHRTMEYPEAYITIFKQFFSGDQSLFPSAEEQEIMWDLCDRIKAYPHIVTRYDGVIPLEVKHGLS